ncbi:hypothetical protein [Shewanella algae]|uniref:hypothetical protein n=1 Tax=Shewanella algae TaxID=38313 RepID=UPI0031F542EF
MNHPQPHLEQQQAEPATPSANKPRLISPEMLGEAIDKKKLNESRMAAWIASIRNQTDF